MSNEIKQKWQEVSIARQNANTNSKNADTEYKKYLNEKANTKIKEFDADLKAEYPGLWNTVGKILNDFIGLGDDDKGDKLYRTVKEH